MEIVVEFQGVGTVEGEAGEALGHDWRGVVADAFVVEEAVI